MNLQVNFGNFLSAAPDQYKVLGLIVLLPLIGAIINGVFGRRIGRDGVYIVGVATVGASFLLSVFAFVALVRAQGVADAAATAARLAEGANDHAGHAHAQRPAAQLSYLAWEWFRAPVGSATLVQLKFRYALDALSGLMLLVVTGVGTVIHVYSTGYMAHDKGYWRYFAYLNLFMFSMLNLILGDSIPLLFVGWEGVGLCSYLLIGFWYTNSQYASAGRKAFIVNRIGDVGVILGMTILAWRLGAWDFAGLREAVTTENSGQMHDLLARPELNDFLAKLLSFGSSGLHDFIYRRVPTFSWGSLAVLLLFIGCTGKSAQFPLYVWLPDAMAGPTPVSALIHAATMVTAGVYLLCRMSFLYVHFPSVMAVIAVVGAFTALFAATIAVVQNELKKVLAYSTVSQLGFMFIGCGVGAFGSGIFHVYTHAMFKACLFLGAGAVMHACRDKQDIRELGGLRKHIPITFWTFAIATAAIIGTPGLSGFFSKDEILFRALASHNPRVPWAGTVAFTMGLLAATLTAFYMCRLLFLTFWGEFKGWSLDEASYAKGAAGAAANAAIASGAHPAGAEVEPEPSNLPHGAGDPAHHDAHDAHGHDAHGHGHDDHGHHLEGNPWDPPHENPPTMTGPLVVLAVASVVAGWIGLPALFTGTPNNVITRWLSPVVTEWHINHQAAHGKEITAMVLGVAAFAIGAGAAYVIYLRMNGAPARSLAASARPLYQLVSDKWRVDELYDATIVRFTKFLAWFANGFDKFFIDGLVNAVGIVPRAFGAILRKLQTGAVHTYGAVLAFGALAVLGWMVLTPQVAISHRAQGTQLTVQAHGGPGYAYQWDPEGDGFQGDFGDPAQRVINCTPVDTTDGRRVCRVGLRARNAFGLTTQVVRLIEISGQ